MTETSHRTDSPDREMLETYAAWLYFERRRLCAELWPGIDVGEFVKVDNAAWGWHSDAPSPSGRAEAMLTAAGLIGNRSTG